MTPVEEATTDRLFRVVVIGYLFLSLADCLTTVYVLPRGGRERNPVAASLYVSYGPAALFAFKGLVVAIIVVTLSVLPRRPALWVGTVFTVTAGLVVAANLGAVGHVR